MTARLNSEPATPKRVVSVSAHAADAESPPAATPLQASIASKPLDEQIIALRAMIDEASSLGSSAQQTLERIHQGEARAVEASANLHERLRLSARMLQAFQSQSAEAEKGAAALEDRRCRAEAFVKTIDARCEEFEARAGALTQRLLARLEGAAEGAIARFDQIVNDRRVVLQAIDDRIDAVAQRSEAIQHSIDAAEKNLLGVIERCDRARQSLSTELAATQKGIDDASGRSEDIRRLIRETMSQCAVTQHDLREELIVIQETIDQIEQAAPMCRAMEALLDRLAKWEPLVFAGENAGGLPESLTKVAGEIHRTIDEDVAALSQSMREMVARIEKIAAIKQRFADASAPMRRVQNPDERPPLEIVTSKGRRKQTGESKPPLRLQKWASGG